MGREHRRHRSTPTDPDHVACGQRRQAIAVYHQRTVDLCHQATNADGCAIVATRARSDNQRGKATCVGGIQRQVGTDRLLDDLHGSRDGRSTGNRQAHVAGTGPQGRLGGQPGRPRHALRPCQHPAGALPLVGVVRTGWHEVDHVDVLDQLHGCVGHVEADVGHIHPTGQSWPVGEQKARLERPEGDRANCCRRAATGHARQAVQPGGEVHGQHRHTGGGRHVRATQAGAVGGVDH